MTDTTNTEPPLPEHPWGQQDLTWTTEERQSIEQYGNARAAHAVAQVPPLPEPDHTLDSGSMPFFREDQMRAYGDARAAHAVAQRQGEPVAYMWQHDETGRIGFVEAEQIANGFEAANPRLHIIGPLYRPTAPATAEQPQAPEITDTMKTYTHKHQPSDNVLVYRMGHACAEAARGPAGDYIDTGLILLRTLEAHGFGITSLNPSLPERMSRSGIAEQPQAREITDAEIDAAIPQEIITATTDAYWLLTKLGPVEDKRYHIVCNLAAAIALANGEGVT